MVKVVCIYLCLHVRNDGINQFGVIHKRLLRLCFCIFRDIGGNILKFYGINGLLVRSSHSSRGLFAAEFPDDCRQNRDDQQHNQQVDQIDLAEQTAFFIDQFHVVPPKEFAVDLPR